MPSIVGEVAETFVTLVKGFSVTLRAMFRKTTTENFPEVPPSVQPRYRGIHVLQRDENGLREVRRLLSVRRRLPRELHLHRSRGEHRVAAHFRRRALREKSTTLIIRAAFSAATVSRLAPPTRSPTATASSSLRTTSTL